MKNGHGFAEGILAARGMNNCNTGCGPYGAEMAAMMPWMMMPWMMRGNCGPFGGYGNYGGACAPGYVGGYGPGYPHGCGPDGFRWLDTQGELREIDKDVNDTDRDVLNSKADIIAKLTCDIAALRDKMCEGNWHNNEAMHNEARAIEKVLCGLLHDLDKSTGCLQKSIDENRFVLSKEIDRLSREFFECCCKLNEGIKDVRYDINDKGKDILYKVNDAERVVVQGIKDSECRTNTHMDHFERRMDDKFCKVFHEMEHMEHKITCNQKELARAQCEAIKIQKDLAISASLTDALNGQTDPVAIAKIQATITALQSSNFTCPPQIAC